VAIHNLVRGNVMEGMRFLIQARVPIARPDDFFAEMLKSDDHMASIKMRLLKQQQKIKAFEEKKHKGENKKLHKALKDHKMRSKHVQKNENIKNIEKLKKRVKQNGGDTLGDDEFDKIMNKKDQGKGKKKGPGVFDTVRDKQKKKNQFK
jgi:rRNA-processing protein EBP2